MAEPSSAHVVERAGALASRAAATRSGEPSVGEGSPPGPRRPWGRDGHRPARAADVHLRPRARAERVAGYASVGRPPRIIAHPRRRARGSWTDDLSGRSSHRAEPPRAHDAERTPTRPGRSPSARGSVGAAPLDGALARPGCGRAGPRGPGEFGLRGHPGDRPGLPRSARGPEGSRRGGPTGAARPGAQHHPVTRYAGSASPVSPAARRS